MDGMYRHRWGDEPENPWLKVIRDNELANPAPFSGLPLLVGGGPENIAKCPDLGSEIRGGHCVVADVPVIDIVAINVDGNLDNYERGMTFREVLFNCLHGHSLTQHTLDWFLSDCVKADHRRHSPEYVAYPQNENVPAKAKGTRGVELTRYGNKYVIEQGKQRTLIAMFWIFQNRGPAGLFKGVGVFA